MVLPATEPPTPGCTNVARVLAPPWPPRCPDSGEPLGAFESELDLRHRERAGVAGLRLADCLYLGDDLRDIQAARAAGMRAIAVGWGYHHPENGGPGTWQADAVISHPRDLIGLL